MSRRTRTTKIEVSICTTFKDLANTLGISVSTLSARYHRLKDAHPRRAVKLDDLRVNHKTTAMQERLG